MISTFNTARRFLQSQISRLTWICLELHYRAKAHVGSEWKFVTHVQILWKITEQIKGFLLCEHCICENLVESYREQIEITSQTLKEFVENHREQIKLFLTLQTLTEVESLSTHRAWMHRHHTLTSCCLHCNKSVKLHLPRSAKYTILRSWVSQFPWREDLIPCNVLYTMSTSF